MYTFELELQGEPNDKAGRNLHTDLKEKDILTEDSSAASIHYESTL